MNVPFMCTTSAVMSSIGDVCSRMGVISSWLQGALSLYEFIISNLRCLPTMVAVANAELKYRKMKHKLIMHLLDKNTFMT